MMKLTVDAPAKINLILDILGTLENGYHDLYMIMQSVDLSDTVTVTQTDSRQITLTCSKAAIPAGSQNIAYRAAEVFFQETGVTNTGISIHIEKKIPHAAGLAGGSTDGAAVLVALNALYQTKLRERDLCRIGLHVGADVPFCISGGTMIAQGIGDRLTPIQDMPACCLVLAKPEQGVSTAAAYSSYDDAGGCRHPDSMGVLTALQRGDIVSLARTLGNVFEQLIDVPQRIDIKATMRRFGALGACMSGSGPTVFGIFDDMAKAQLCADAMQVFVNEVFICHPNPYGCQIIKSE